ncbi:MAG: hypothetical protein HZB75_01330 [Candidatus Saccharibacteria bacterium]|nr:MAG: hypothetical protein HZB75_01330 [Candidatus Saccharibacteria bacterium]
MKNHDRLLARANRRLARTARGRRAIRGASKLGPWVIGRSISPYLQRDAWRRSMAVTA